jgi:peptide/nickel transport system substrate-binding protein
MDGNKPLNGLIGAEESTRIMGALKSGATRRDVLSMLAAGGMQARLAGSIASVAVSAHAQAPRRGGRIKVAGSTGAVSDTLDPARQSNGTDYVRGFMFYDSLTYLDGTLTPQPQLAEEFTTKDAKTWVFRLRKGVTFHDGKPLTPQDVVFSVMRHKNPATGSLAKPLADQIDEVTATGPNEVTFRLAAANADLPVILGTYHFHIVKEGTTDFNAGIGTGPYKVKDFKPGIRAVGVRNGDYWNPGRPYLDEIEHVGIADEAARVNGLLSGELDLVLGIDPRSVSRVAGSSQHAVFETKAGPYTDLILRRDSSPGNNPDFVLGMKYLFNREQMIKTIMLGHGVLGNDQPIHPAMRFYFNGLKQRAYDPEKAKWHLQRANIGSAAIPMIVSPVASGSIEIATFLQREAAKAGVNFEMRRMPADGYWAQHWMKHPVGFGMIQPRPSADVMLSLFFRSGAPQNESAWKSGRFDQLLQAARAEIDETKRARMYADMQTLVHDESGIGIPYFMSALDGHVRKLKGLSPIPLGNLMGFSFSQYVWLDA